MSLLITKPAPDFTAGVVTGEGRIEDSFTLSSLAGKYVVLFFYPEDFTYVCPTEILAFDEHLEDFREREAEIIGVSVDSLQSHVDWRKTPLEKGGIGPIRYPLVSDKDKSIARQYGILHETGVALRGLFLIDRDGIVRHSLVNDLPLGRQVTETLRILDALRLYDERGEVCPSKWKKGDAGMKETKAGVIDYLTQFAKKRS
jgi:peroxiredoxin (alkyl hydroperoxide reductase subunit C)